MPKVAPIIIAALPIPNSLNANALFEMHMKIVDGLIDRGLRIISYACDGTEVERSVQKLFLQKASQLEFRITNPRPGCNDTVATLAVYRGQTMTIIQDSKHALKTMRNNLFSGARFLVFGNHTAMFRHILQIVQGEGSPLYTRDVLKLDRQDDNAAVRLFSAATLQYLVDNHPDCVGEIVYLFVFGELVDAFQSRTITHAERLKLVLRARYFLDSWESYLNICGYRKDHYFISREATDILRILIEGFIALIIIHRDYLSSPTPFLPWLHSSECCEHVFGEARHVIKDFTFLDLIYMIPKLRIKLHAAAIRGKGTSGKARASGYSHTYFDHEGLSLETLSTFPSDKEITTISDAAAQEANSLIAILGINPRMLHPSQSSSTHHWLPSIHTWFDEEMEFLEAEGDDEAVETEGKNEAEELQQILKEEENSPIGRRAKVDQKCLTLTSAALALAAEESAVV